MVANFTSTPPLLLFTDLDGTLLDHHSYSWRAAEEALELAKARHVPVIFNTSKTLSESEEIQQEIGLDGPIIFENGAGVAVPKRLLPAPAESTSLGRCWLKSFTVPYADVLKALQDLRREGYTFQGFADMTVEEICAATGLAPDAAANAKQRRFGEPVIWHESNVRLAEFQRALRERGLTTSRGGRFVHVMGSADKGQAMLWLARWYGKPPPRLVALGDRENDLPMLSKADMAVVVRSPVQEPPTLPLGQRPPAYLVTEAFGPAGWNRAVIEIIKELGDG